MYEVQLGNAGSLIALAGNLVRRMKDAHLVVLLSVFSHMGVRAKNGPRVDIHVEAKPSVNIIS